MQQNSLNAARAHIISQHANADGWITMAQKDPVTKQFRQYHYKPEEIVDSLAEWTGENVFFSQNTFYKPQRAVENIRQLRSLYVDLDTYNVGLTPEFTMQRLEYEVFGNTLPEPNTVIYSGQGLVLVWNIEPVPYQAMALWRAVELHFINQLKEMGADSKASDPTRIFRLSGTRNSKNGAIVQAEYRHNYRYDIHQLQYDYLPELSPNRLKVKKAGRKKKVVHLFNIYTLHIARARDLSKLIDLRFGRVGDCREYICFLYRYFTCCITEDPAEALEATLALNERLSPPLSEKEVRKATESAEKAWRAKSQEKANEIARSKGYPGAGYNLTNAVLIEWLQITPEEEKHLSTIISKKENRRREKEKRHQNGMLPRDVYLKQEKEKTDEKLERIRAIIKENPKISVRGLSEKTGLSKSAVQRLRSRL